MSEKISLDSSEIFSLFPSMGIPFAADPLTEAVSGAISSPFLMKSG